MKEKQLRDSLHNRVNQILKEPLCETGCCEMIFGDLQFYVCQAVDAKRYSSIWSQFQMRLHLDEVLICASQDWVTMMVVTFWLERY